MEGKGLRSMDQRDVALLVLAETAPVLSARFLAFMSSVTFFKPFVTESPCGLTHTRLAGVPLRLPHLHCWTALGAP